MKFLRTWFAKRPAALRQAPSFRPTCEALEDRQLLSGASLTPLDIQHPVPPPPNDLHDALVRPVAQAEFAQEGRLSRTDVIHLLDVVDGMEKAVFSNGQVSFLPTTLNPRDKPDPWATLTASELTDLQALVHDAAAWGLTSDVANLAGKVVNFSPANVDYQGNVLLPAGQLSAGNRVTVLRDLVGKWFYGSDLPDTTAAANGIPQRVVYKTAEGVLFGPGGPSGNDIAQGWVADCYFLSSLGEVAVQSPQTIKEMFTNNQDGTYTVRFFQYNTTNHTWQPDYVTVDLRLPVLQNSGQFAFAGWYQGGNSVTYTGKNVVLWPALAEKAYAQLAEEGWSRSTGPGGSGNDSTPSDWDRNCYDALSYGNGVALQQITGDCRTYDVGLATATAADEAALERALHNGNLVIVASPAQEPASVPTNAAHAPLIITGHVYFLKSADAQHDQFTLVNPYDDSSYYAGDGQRTVTLTWAQLRKYLSDYFVVAPPLVASPNTVVLQAQYLGGGGHTQAVSPEWFDNASDIVVRPSTLPIAPAILTGTGAGQHVLPARSPDSDFQPDQAEWGLGLLVSPRKRQAALSPHTVNPQPLPPGGTVLSPTLPLPPPRA